MGQKPKKTQSKSEIAYSKKNLVTSSKSLRHYFWPKSFLRRLLTILITIILLFLLASYGVARWYVHKHHNEPLTLGTTFVPAYAKEFGLNPTETLQAIFADLGMKQVRLVSYWNDIEPTPGKYDFKELDSEFALANKYNAKISLAIGLRQPRWPECHEPDWITIDPKNPQNWQPQLNKYIKAVINRYKSNPALHDYQLENEFLMTVFGECKDFNRNRLVSEFNMVKKLDPMHPVVISRSNNWVGIPVRPPVPDEFGISIYKRVWDASLTHRYFEYPLPANFYSALAGWEELYSGKNMLIHELQAEPWSPNGKLIQDISVKEQFKSMNANRLKARITYGEDTGMREIYLWGAEWWYWLKVKHGDSSVWNVVKQEVLRANLENKHLNQDNSLY